MTTKKIDPTIDNTVTAEDVADVHQQWSEVYSRDATDQTVAVAEGANVKIRVDRGCLIVNDGHGDHLRERQWARTPCRLRRLVVFGRRGGFITMEAMRWLRELDIPLLMADAGNGQLLFASATRTKDDARLRRAQAAAGTTPVGLRIAVDTMTAKLVGQARIARKRLHREDIADTIDTFRGALADAVTVDEVCQLEATAANVYWSAWAGNDATALRFAARDRQRVPEHWLRFDTRRSALTDNKSNRKAERPVNALANYLYALAAIEVRLATLAVGLDPGLGLVHADAAGRDSMVLDILETVRPAVDEFLLGLISQRSWRKTDFAERGDGTILLGLDVRHTLADTMPTWARATAPVAEQLAHRLGDTLHTMFTPTSTLTGTARREAAAAIKARKSEIAAATVSRNAGRRRAPVTPQLFRTCVDCGGLLTGPSNRPARQIRCERCWQAMPGQTATQRQRRGRAIAASRTATEAWKAEHPDQRPDAEAFAPIREGLAKVRLVDIMTAAGIAKSTASAIRAGSHTPALHHWTALANLAGVTWAPGE